MTHMKFLYILFACSFSLLVQADFNTATEDYANKNYQQAYNEFYRLAQLGNKRAQFNLGVMHLNGEFVQQDDIKAFAWGKLSEHKARPEFSQISQSLNKKLSPDQLEQAEIEYQKLKQAYGEAEIYATLSPIVYQASGDKGQSAENYQLKIIERKAPRFPKGAMEKRMQGWATVGFEVYPDGTVRNPYVIDAYPKNVFEKETISAVEKFKFEVKFNPDIEPYPIDTRQTIEYEIGNTNQTKTRQLYDQRLQQLEDLANQGSAEAQYIYAIAASSNLLNEDHKLSNQEVNEWLLKSAQNGHLEAQYLLGKNILIGRGCQVDKQKGIDWIVYAAEQGHPKSSLTAYSLLTKHQNLNNTQKPAIYWLKQAAQKGDADSQLEYAEFLANQENPQAADLALAREYLESQARQRDKSVTWYQVSADIYQHQGEEKKAQKHQKKADKIAKKLGWEI